MSSIAKNEGFFNVRRPISTRTDPNKITLYYREGSSDKIYHAAVEAAGTGFVVNFAYGRRGSTLQTGTKTAKPVEYAAARNIYDKLVFEKTAKEYSPRPSSGIHRDFLKSHVTSLRSVWHLRSTSNRSDNAFAGCSST